MSIMAFIGDIGSGKTVTAVDRGIEYMARGGLLVSNITLKMDGVQKRARRKYGVEIDPSQYIKLDPDDLAGEFWRLIPGGTREKPTLAIFDEIQDHYNARDTLQKDRKVGSGVRRVLDFLTKSRKLHVDVIFVSQAISNVDKQWRTMCNCMWNFVDVEKFHIAGLGGIRTHVPVFVCARFAKDFRTYTGPREWRWKDQELFDCYDTDELFMESMTLQGYVMKGPKKVGKVGTMSWKKVGVAVGVSACVCYGMVARMEKKVLAAIESSKAAAVPAALPEKTAPASAQTHSEPAVQAVVPVAVMFNTDGTARYYQSDGSRISTRARQVTQGGGSDQSPTAVYMERLRAVMPGDAS